MQSILSRTALLAMLVALSLPVAAQKVKIENQGEASVGAEASALTAEAVEKAVGRAPDGKSQVVFFRSAKSPGARFAFRGQDSALVRIGTRRGQAQLTSAWITCGLSRRALVRNSVAEARRNLSSTMQG